MEEKKITNEKLARMIAKGFDGMQGQFDGMQGQFNGMQSQFNKMQEQVNGVDERLQRVEGDVDYLKTKVNGIASDLKELKKDHVTRLEFEDSLSRVKLLEKKAGIVSGK